ncbi:MAG: CvpA family protein [Roseiflexaceae bacterium]|nr:CvpA family protein [Roseiflexaceae bacterium]
MNIVDLLIIVLMIAALAIGLFQGIIRLMISIIVLYVSIVLASLYFQPLGNFFRVQFNSTVQVGQVTAFAAILMLAFILLLMAGLYTFRYVQMPTSLEFLDRIIGTLLGLLLGGLLIGMFTVLLRELFVSQSPCDTLNYPFVCIFQSGVRSSVLVQTFNSFVLPLIYRTVDPVLPPEANIIFQIR